MIPGKLCYYRDRKSDSRYPDKIPGVAFMPCPKSKTNMAKCLTWIRRACGRLHQFTSSMWINEIVKESVKEIAEF